MDAELRKIELLLEKEPTAENYRKFRVALIRRGLPCGYEIGDIVRVIENPRFKDMNYVNGSWIGQILYSDLTNSDHENISIKFLEIETGLFGYEEETELKKKKYLNIFLSDGDKVEVVDPV